MGPIMARFAPRVMVAQAAPPDEQGKVSLALHVGGTRDELLAAGRDPERLLIIEVNPHLPRTGSLPPTYDNSIPLDVIDVLVESDGAPFALTDPPATEVDETIARHALAYVHDGSTLQTGIGAIPNIVAAELARGPLGGFGVHSEMFTTGLMRLHQSGKVTNDAKGMFDGVSVTTFALGVSELYQWLDGNEEVAFLPVDTVNDPTIISRNANLVSINGALVGRPLRPGDGRQHRWPPDLGCRWARGLRGGRRAAPRCPLTHLPAFDGQCATGRWSRALPGSRPRGRSSPRHATTRASSSPSTAWRS